MFNGRTNLKDQTLSLAKKLFDPTNSGVKIVVDAQRMSDSRAMHPSIRDKFVIFVKVNDDVKISAARLDWRRAYSDIIKEMKELVTVQG